MRGSEGMSIDSLCERLIKKEHRLSIARGSERTSIDSLWGEARAEGAQTLTNVRGSIDLCVDVG